MHSRAHHDRDPIFGKMRALRMKKQGTQIAEQCARCHNPRSPSRPDTPAGLVGVSCAGCHLIEQIHPTTSGKVGADALVYSEQGVMRSASTLPEDASPVHGLGPALDGIKDGKTLCLSCHNQTRTPSGAPACTTGPEYSSADGASGADARTCVSCHMPEVQGGAGAVGGSETHRSHAFLGPHRAWYQDDTSILEQAVELSGVFREDTLQIELLNRSSHAFPSGFPGRMMILEVEGLDAKGQVIWKNFEHNALEESPASVFNKVYHDQDGKPVPAAFAQELVRDTRLAPDEQRQVVFTEVPSMVMKARVQLLYFLLPPPLARKLGLQDELEARPVMFLEQHIER